MHLFNLDSSNPADNYITFKTDETEVLKISRDGFYVRGVKIPQDEHEAEAVHKAFKQFLAWAIIKNS